MLALITNDDGIDSPGLTVLAEAASDAGCEVIVAAPYRQYSGASAALTAQEEHGRLLLVEGRPPGLAEDVRSFGVKAAPALISFVAAFGAFGRKPDLVLSGVNLGANTGHATLHSGTVGAALSAATQGINAMAVSIASDTPQHWHTARIVTDHALAWLMAREVDERVLNVNVPDVPPEQLRGLRPAFLASFGAVQARVRDTGRNWVQLTYSGADTREEPGSDHHLLSRGWATATLMRPPSGDDSGVRLPEFRREVDSVVADAGAAATTVGSGIVMSAGADRPAGEIEEDAPR